jgi:guanyl-specific ribonuclease Sa
MTTQHRITSTLAVTFALTLATGTPAASASSAQLRRSSAPHHPRAAYSRQDKAVLPPNNQAVVRVQAPGGGFDWGDAGIGAAGGFALSMIGIGGALVVSQRRTRPSDTAPAR